MILQATSVTDLSFRLMDVVMIVGGVSTMITNHFIQKGKIERLKDSQDTYKTITDKQIDYLVTELKSVEANHGAFKGDIFKRLDTQNESIHTLSNQITKLTQIIENKKE